MLITFHCFKLFNHSNVMNDVQDTKSNQNKDEDSHMQNSNRSVDMAIKTMALVICPPVGALPQANHLGLRQ